MAGTIPIPLTSLTVGPHGPFGPANVGTTDSGAEITIDRTVANGLNTKPTAAIACLIEISFDSGTNWQTQSQATFTGGVRSDPEIGQLNTDYLFVQLPQPGNANRRVRATLTVAGTTVSVAGSLIVT